MVKVTIVHLVCLVAKQILLIIVLHSLTGKITRLSFSVNEYPYQCYQSWKALQRTYGLLFIKKLLKQKVLPWRYFSCPVLSWTFPSCWEIDQRNCPVNKQKPASVHKGRTTWQPCEGHHYYSVHLNEMWSHWVIGSWETSDQKSKAPTLWLKVSRHQHLALTGC